jgi:dephospho-CoA kinase
MKSVVIIGKMCSGKSTAANYLFEEIPNSKILALAKPIYDLVNNIEEDYRSLIDKYILPYYDPRDSIQQKLYLEVPDDFYLKWKKIIFETRFIPEEKPKPRKRLQFLGTSARERIDDKIWVKVNSKRTKQEPNTTWIIDDCRFKNEFEWFEKSNWQPIFLYVSKHIQKARIRRLYGKFDESILKHPSEAEIDKIRIPTECIIDSNQSIEAMLHDIKEFLWKKENFS